MKKRIISMILVLATLLGMLPTTVFAAQDTASAHPFTDVKAIDWYDEYVTYVWENSLFNGLTETTFAPKDKLTRGMFVTVLGRMAGADTDDYTDAVFTDVDPADWYGPYVAWAAENEITTGIGGGLFAPGAYVTREQIATFILRYLALIGYDTGAGKALTYIDKDQISDYALEAVAVCLALGLIEGDTNNRFRPGDSADRAEAAAIFARLHQLLDGGQVPDDDDDRIPPVRPSLPILPDDDDDKPGTTTTYHKVSFSNPTASEFAADTLPESTTVESNSLVYALPVPEKEGYVFGGWYYDGELTEVAATTDTVTADMILYPKMVERTSDAGITPVGSLDYVSALEVGTDFTVQVRANSEQQIREALSFQDFTDFNKEVAYSVTANGGGIYTLTPNGGLIAGHSYQINAVDRDHDMEFAEDGSVVEPDYVLFIHEGEEQVSKVRYYNITVHREEHMNMRLNDDLIFIPYSQVSGFSFEDSAMYSTDLESINTSSKDGTFVYDGGDLQVGDVVAIYDGVLNTDHLVDGEVAYAQITAIHGNIHTYVTPGIGDVIFLPKALPVPLDDAATEDVDGAIVNEDGTVTVYNEYLDFSAFSDIEELSLDGSTVARVGDYLVLYEGEPETTTNYSYWEITQIDFVEDSAVTVFTATQVDEVATISAYEVYGGDLSIEDDAIKDLEEETRQQVLESGFAEDAANYLATVLFSDEEVQDAFGGYSLRSVSVRSSDPTAGKEWYEGGEWNISDGDNNMTIQAGELEFGFGSIMVELGEVDVHVNISKKLKEISAMDAGIRTELGITFPVQIGTYLVGTGWTDCIYLEVSASFVQEISFAPYASIDLEWDKWWIFPYIDDIIVGAGVDVGSYTGVGATFTVATDNQYDTLFPWTTAIQSIDPNYDPSNPSVDSIAKKLQSMMSDESSFLEGKDGNSLIKEYQKLLSMETDYAELLAIRFGQLRIKVLAGIVEFYFSVEFEIIAKMAVTLGIAAEHLAVRRYSFTLRLFDGRASTNQFDLQTPYTNLNLYVMGNLGLRVGPRLTFKVSALSGVAKKHNLCNVGANISFGPAFDFYGIYFYHFEMRNGKTVSSRAVGALDSSFGMYIDLDFFFGAFLDLVSARLHALDFLVYFNQTKDESKILEPVQRQWQQKIYNDETFTINNRYLNMYTLRVRSAETGTRSNLKYENFDVALSNKNFHYDAETGTISVTQPDETTLKMDCQVRLTYKGGDTLFQSLPTVITIDLTWEKTWPKYAVRFYGDTYYGSSWENGNLSLDRWPDRSTLLKQTVYVAGDILDAASCPPPSKVGYDFVGWRYLDTSLDGVGMHTPLEDLNSLEGYIMPEDNIDFAAVFEPRNDTPYKIEYYLETAAGTGAYELYKTVAHTGTTGSADQNMPVGTKLKADIAADMGNPEGFSINWMLYPGAENLYFGSFYIEGDGSTVVRVYYDRKDYSVYFHANNRDYPNTSVIHVNGPYGSAMATPMDFAQAELPGWTFVGWATEPKASEPNVDIPATIPFDEQGGVMVNGTYYPYGTHYFAVWKPSYNYITVNHYIKEPDGTYKLEMTEVGSNENEQTHRIGGLTGSFISSSNFVREFDAATYSHRVCVDADGVENDYVAGITTADTVQAVHNGQTLNLYYNRKYNRVTWQTSEGDVIQYYYKGQQVIAPENLSVDEQVGYRIDGWRNTLAAGEDIYRQAGDIVMEDRGFYFTPNYVPADGIQYIVVHARQKKTGGFDYEDETLTETEIFYGTTDTIVTPEVKTYEGFISPEPKELYIRANGSAKMIYEYDREDYRLTVDYNGGTETGYATNYFYDTPINLPERTTREGYDLVGWELQNEGLTAEYSDDLSYVIGGSCMTSMQDLTFVAQWQPKPIEYQVEHYLEQADGTFKLDIAETIDGEYLQQITASPREFQGRSFDETAEGSVLSGTLNIGETLTLKLYYIRNSYEAKWYDYDGTTLLATTDVKYEDPIIAPDIAGSRLGYTFGGWQIDTVFMGIHGAAFNAKDHGNWTTNTYTICFDANGGEGSMEPMTFTYGQMQALTANILHRAGYTFNSWNTQADGSGTRYEDQAQLTNLTAVNGEEITLYAQWDAGDGITYTVAYYLEDLTGGGHAVLEDTFTGLAGSTATAVAKEIPGFTFDEGNAHNVLSGTIAGDGSLVLELYYTRNSYTLTLDFNGESMKRVDIHENPMGTCREIIGFEVEDMTFELKYGETMEAVFVDIMLTVIEEEEYEIWDEETGQWVPVPPIYKEVPFDEAFPGYTFDRWDGLPVDGAMPAEELTLTAQWNPIEVKVTFFPGASYVTGEPFTETYYYGDEIPLPTDHGFTYGEGSREFFVDGWAWGTYRYDTPYIVETLVLVDHYYTYGEYCITEESEIYEKSAGEAYISACWASVENRHTISFHSNGGAGEMSDQYVTGDSGYCTALKSNTFTRDGYRFIGWSEKPTYNPDTDTLYDDNLNIGWDRSLTLYAQWEKVE